ncbi:MAG: glycosyltransferase family 39 protein, partial [Chloroflexota bacterium]
MRQPGSQGKGSFIAPAIALAAAGLLALILYWPTLRLPLIYDDLLHIRISGGLDLLSVWLPTEEFGFYRPLTFLPLLIIENLFGRYPAGLLHGLNVFQHALNVVLLGLLSWRLWRRPRWTVVATLLMAFFPFSYQAIAVYGHNVHPTTTGILLLALNTYLSAIRATKRQWLWWLLTAGLFVLGLLSHESAILFGALAALVHWNARGKLPVIRRGQFRSDLGTIARQPWFLFLLAGGLYAIGYQLLPLTRAPQASFQGAALWYKFLYVAQAAGYPLAWFGRWLAISPAVAVAVVLLALLVALE